MNARVLVFGVMLAACSGVACTAFILNKIDDQKEYENSSGGPNSSSSSSGGAPVDECSLLRSTSISSFGEEPPAPPNLCSKCIQENCTAHVDFACNRDGGERGWFRPLRTCAQNPWDRYADPDSGAGGSWGCMRYDNDLKETTGESLAAKEYEADRCVQQECLDKKRDCRLCEVSTETPGTNPEIKKLSLDRCGKCLLTCTNSSEIFSQCCSSEPMQRFVEPCAFTESKDYKAQCRMLLDAGDEKDGSTIRDPQGRYTERDKACAFLLSNCFKTKCAALPECQ